MLGKLGRRDEASGEVKRRAQTPTDARLLRRTILDWGGPIYSSSGQCQARHGARAKWRPEEVRSITCRGRRPRFQSRELEWLTTCEFPAQVCFSRLLMQV